MAKSGPDRFKDWKPAEKAVAFFRPFKTLEMKTKEADARRALDRQRALFETTDFNPEYATQRAQSPQARAYLESFMAGNNPDAIFSTEPNAKYRKEDAQAAKDKMFGTNEQLIQQGRDIRNAPMRDVMENQDAQIFAAENPGVRETRENGIPDEFVKWYKGTYGTTNGWSQDGWKKAFSVAQQRGWNPNTPIGERIV